MEAYLPTKAQLYDAYLTKVKACSRCTLKKEGQHTCPAWGSLDSKIIFYGEAPGRVDNPNLRGIVFVGNRSSDMYHKALTEGGFDFFRVFHSNICKCNPPQNRKPSGEEINACSWSVKEELNILKPKMIVAVGRTAYDFLRTLSNVPGVKGIPVHHVYHPAYILRMGRGNFEKKYLAEFRSLRRIYDKLVS